jgi:uncharacterized repeat protein (TIGR02059 family)
MRYYLVLLFLCASLTLSGTTYFISSTGSDLNNGSSAAPWKTLSYACSKALVSGDIIHVNAGTYIETAQSNLAVGVSIEGDGISSVIRAQIPNTGIALLNISSSTENTNGNQHVSNIKFDGNSFSVSYAILVTRRGHVKIFNVNFINFDRGCVDFNGGSEPTIYANGNEFYNNSVTDCSNYIAGCCGYSSITVVGQEAMLIHDNIISLTGRPSGSNGTGISTRFAKGLKIYNNTITNDPTIHEGSPNLYTFSIEMWNGRGGTEIYNNKLYNGTVDIGGNFEEKGTYPYSVSLHNNFIGRETLFAYDKIGVIIEGTKISDVLIYSNTIKNVNKGIVHYGIPGASYSNISIYYNVFDQIGINKVGSGQRTYGISSYTSSSSSGHSVNNWHIDNNTFIASTVSGGYQNNAILAPNKVTCTVTNIYIRNNIFVGWDESPVFLDSYWGGSIDYLWYQNNNAYGNGHSDDPTLGITPSHYTTSSNIKVDPAFVSSTNYQLQSISPCIGKGINVGLTYDFLGNLVKSPPSIGAYENGSALIAPVVPVAPIYKNSAIANATPSLLEVTYDLSLNSTIIPDVSAFTVNVNSIAVPISSIAISGSKVQLNLSNPVKYGDVITVSYTKPAINPLQSAASGIAASIISQSVINGVISLVKDSNPVSISMAITPNHVHKTMSVALQYTGTTEAIAALSPETLTIADSHGRLLVTKLLVTGVTSVKMAINLKSGIYVVTILGNSVQKATKKMMVF